MKNLYLFSFLLLPLSAISCQQEPDPVPGSIQPVVTEMTFPRWGNTQTLEIEALNLTDWNAYSDMSWIELGEPNLKNGTIEVTVKTTEELNDLHGEIIIYSELEEVAKVAVTQKGNGTIYHRPTSLLLNIKGPVKTVDFYFNPIYVWERNSSHIQNLVFDELGRISSMTYTELTPDMPPVTNTHDATFTFDDQNRPLNMTVISRDLITAYGPYEFSIDFTYDNSEKYIEVHQLFYDYFETAVQLYTDARIWMPRMLKGLRRIDLESNVLQAKSYRMDFEPRDDGSILCSDTIEKYDGTIDRKELYTYYFEGNYTKSCQYWKVAYADMEREVLHSVDFVIDPESGNILSETIIFTDHENNNMTDLLREKHYHSNFINSCYSFYDLNTFGYYMNIEYDEQWNATYINDIFRSVTSEYEYEYDEWGNIVHLDLRIEQPNNRGEYLTQERPYIITYHE